jgi:hypothetical protein
MMISFYNKYLQFWQKTTFGIFRGIYLETVYEENNEPQD